MRKVSKIDKARESAKGCIYEVSYVPKEFLRLFPGG